PPKPSDLLIFPRPVEFDFSPVVGGGPPRYVVREDWTFEVGNMSGLRALAVSVRAPGWALKRVMHGAKDITDVPLDFRRGDVEGLEITLTNQLATITGRALSSDGAPLLDYSVVLFSPNRAAWTFPSRFIQLARP